MTAKKTSPITLLKQANAEIAELKVSLEKVTKERDNEKSYKDHYDKEKTELSNELEQLHGLLDAIEGAAPRKTIGKNSWGGECEFDNKAMTRFASWLAKGKA